MLVGECLNLDREDVDDGEKIAHGVVENEKLVLEGVYENGILGLFLFLLPPPPPPPLLLHFYCDNGDADYSSEDPDSESCCSAFDVPVFGCEIFVLLILLLLIM